MSAEPMLVCPYCSAPERSPQQLFAHAAICRESVFANQCDGCGRDYAVRVFLEAEARELTDTERVLFDVAYPD